MIRPNLLNFWSNVFILFIVIFWMGKYWNWMLIIIINLWRYVIDNVDTTISLFGNELELSNSCLPKIKLLFIFFQFFSLFSTNVIIVFGIFMFLNLITRGGFSFAIEPDYKSQQKWENDYDYDNGNHRFKLFLCFFLSFWHRIGLAI